VRPAATSGDLALARGQAGLGVRGAPDDPVAEPAQLAHGLVAPAPEPSSAASAAVSVRTAARRSPAAASAGALAEYGQAFLKALASVAAISTGTRRPSTDRRVPAASARSSSPAAGSAARRSATATTTAR
jgi:hypothetical protein